jgi:hypothetical protein
MPLTGKGEKVLDNMQDTYGSTEKAKQVLYASKNSGKITGIDAQSTSANKPAPTASGPAAQSGAQPAVPRWTGKVV